MHGAIRQALLRLATGAALVLASTVPTQAQTIGAMDDDWHFVIAPYMWFAGLEGTLSVRDIVEVPVDVPFSDVISNFDIGLLAHFEGRKSRAGFAVDILYLSLDAPVAADAPVLGRLGISAHVRLFIAEGLGFYRAATGGSSNNPAHLDVIVGARYYGTSARLEGDVRETGRRSLDWVDGLAGLRFRAPLGSRVAVLGRGDVAGFGSKFTWNLEGDLAVKISEHWSLGAGWRHLDIEYDKGDGANRSVYDVAFDGPRAWASFAW
jgi:hypothetical protein